MARKKQVFSHSDRFIKFCATVWIGQRSKFECHQKFLYLFTTANADSRAKRGKTRTDILLVSLVLLHQWLADMIWWHKSLSQSQRTLIQTKLANEVLDCLRFMQFSYICIFMYFFFWCRTKVLRQAVLYSFVHFFFCFRSSWS